MGKWKVLLCTPEKNPWCKRKDRHAIVVRPDSMFLAAITVDEGALTRALEAYVRGDRRG